MNEPLRVFAATPEDTPLSLKDGSVRKALLTAAEACPEFAVADSAVDADVVVLFERIGFKTRAYAAALEQDAFLHNHVGKLFTINNDDSGHGLLAGLYAGLEAFKHDKARHRACGYIYSPNPKVLQLQPADSEPAFLASFRGNLISASVRRNLFKLHRNDSRLKLAQVETWQHYSEADKEAYVREILDSKFVLCPRGWSPSSYRVFETMCLRRAPVIISDNWLPPQVGDWNEFALFVKQKDIRYLPRILEERSDEWRAMGEQARHVWERFFSPDHRHVFFLRQILSLLKERPAAHSEAEVWRNWRNSKLWAQNGWTLCGRVKNRVKSQLRL